MTTAASDPARAPTRCPACRGGTLAPVEEVEVDALARHWASDPSVAGRRSGDEIRRDILADLGGATRVRFDRCAACGVEAATPMRGWTGAHYPPGTYGLAFDHQQALARLARGTPGARLLEIGCADGQFLDAAAALGYRASGIDFSPDEVAAARARGLDVTLTPLARLAEVTGGERYDVVAFFQVIEHLEDPDALFHDLAGVTRPGTELMIGCPSPDRYSRRTSHPERIGSSDYWDFPPQHTLRWTDRGLRAFLGRHGWRVTASVAEPFTVRGAAAHLTGMDVVAGTVPPHGLRRRLRTARRALDLLRVRRPVTGVRLFVAATRT